MLQIPMILVFKAIILPMITSGEFLLGAAASTVTHKVVSLLSKKPEPIKVVKNKPLVSLPENWKLQTAGAAVGGIYLGSILWNLSIDKLLKNGWNNWQSDFSLEDLHKISSKKLYDQLCGSIALKHNSFNTEFYEQFLSETGNELTALKRYVGIGLKLQKCKIGSLLLFSDKKIKKATKNIERLKYIRNIFYQETISHKMK
ncbi:TPA: hypothetical protein DIC20_05760 [Candidatus Dependentiae bacterium]|nr:hypothetical protein [Candidatus Dependentiae bacterium]HCU01171.1 hypothetical protein [Candidatus Dependentiae bacterium]